MENTTEKQGGVQSIRRALSILEVFSLKGPQLTIAEICLKVNLPRPTVTRLMATLANEGYLVRDPGTRKYGLGVKLCRLGAIAQNSWGLKKVAFPVLRELRNRFGETAYVDVIDGFERLCILSVEGNQSVRTVVPVGQTAPLHAGSDGRILLAYQPEKMINELIEKNNLKANTPQTITDPDILKDELAKIRQNGFAVSYGEWVPGSVGISAPVKDETGEVMAAVSISIPDYRADEEVVTTYTPAVREAAYQISKLLGYEERNVK